MTAQPNTEWVCIGRESAMLKWDSNRFEAKESMLVDGLILTRVNGCNMDYPDIAVELLKARDVRAVARAASKCNHDD